jgi:hypothetical protein
MSEITIDYEQITEEIKDMVVNGAIFVSEN